jgi:glycerate kinase
MTGRVLVAPDKFKGSVTAAEAAAAIAAGLRAGRPDLDVVELPVADGGDGTVAAVVAAGFRPVDAVVEGPTGEPVDATYAVRDSTAVVEMAEAAGLRRLPGGVFAPLTASSYGAGQLVQAALDAGAATIVLGIGGSACTDGGAGLVEALGARLRDADGRPVRRGGAALCELAGVELGELPERLRYAKKIRVASDVANPLLGPSGAAAVFGPQKGASPADVALLDRALERWAALTAAVTGRDVAAAAGAGAAGGTGFAALAYLNAELVPGIDLVLGLIGFDAAAAGADLVITGEGTLDVQTLGGKAPLGVARAAGRQGVRVVAVAGEVLLGRDELAAAGFAAAYSLGELESDLAARVARAGELLEQLGRRMAADFRF